MHERIPIRLVADDVKLGQILINLLSNAVNFTGHGFVELSVEQTAGQGETVSLRLAVTDTGIGIDRSHISSLTDPYSQISAEIGTRYGGAGLGLSLSRKILELYGSTLRVESTLRAGSKFFFYVTLKRADSV